MMKSWKAGGGCVLGKARFTDGETLKLAKHYDPSLWGNGKAEQLSMSAAIIEGNCNPLWVSLQRSITTEHKSKKKVKDVNEWSATDRSVLSSKDCQAR